MVDFASPLPIFIRQVTPRQNDIHEKIKRILNSGNACYHSVKNFLFSSLLYTNIKIKT
jgi:hypothetical protein